MQQDMIAITCPRCEKPFEVDEAYRGSLADCPHCGNMVAVPSEKGDAMFSIRCPACRTEFEVPESYRGEQAECCECQAIFFIPEHGSDGIPVGTPGPTQDIAAAPQPAPSTAPTPSAPPPPSIKPPPQPEYTSSGIQKTPGVRPKQDTRTVTLSRSAVIENTMKPQKRDDLPPEAQRQGSPPPVDDEVPPIEAPGFGLSGDSAAASLLSSKIIMPPSFRGRDEGRPSFSFKKTTGEAAPAAKPEPAPAAEDEEAEERVAPQPAAREPAPAAATAARAARPAPMPTEAEAPEEASVAGVGIATAAAALPGWLAHVRLHEGEQIHGFKATRPAGTMADVALAAAPIVLIPLAALASGMLKPIGSAIVFLIVGAVVGGISLKKVRRLLTTRKALVLTSQRAILVDGETVLETDLRSGA